jgi:hypothetical protein
MKNQFIRLYVVLLFVAVMASSGFAQGSGPIDLASTGTTLASYVAGAAGAGIALLAAMYGVRVILRAFKSVK